MRWFTKAFLLLFTSLAIAQTDIEIPNDASFVIEKNQAVNSLFLHSDVKTSSPYYKDEKLGEKALKEKKWCSAESIYKNLINQDNKIADYHYKYGAALGFELLEDNKLKAIFYIGKVKKQFLIAAKLDKRHIDTRWALIETYLRLPFLLGGSNKKAKFYANELEKISEIDGLLAKGRIAKYTKKYKIAEVYFKRAVAVGGSRNSFYRLAELYDIYLKRPQKALSVLDKAIIKYPNDLRFYYQYGKIALQNNLDKSKGKYYLEYFISHYSKTLPISVDEAYKLLRS